MGEDEMARKKVDTQEYDDEQLDDLEPISREDRPFDDKVEEWIERYQVEGIVPRMYLNRYDDVVKKYVVVDRFEGQELPDEHDIGLKLGSGQYKAVLQYPATPLRPKKTTVIAFTVGKVYDERMAEEKRKNIGMVSAAGGASMPVNNHNDMRDGMYLMADIFKSVMANQQQNKPVIPDMSGLFIDHYKNMNDVIKLNLTETSSLVSELLKSRFVPEQEIEPGQPPEGIEPEKGNLLSILIPEIIKQVLPLIIENPIVAKVLQGIMSKPAAPPISGNQDDLIGEGNED
jgi:hypothetical protein